MTVTKPKVSSPSKKTGEEDENKPNDATTDDFNGIDEDRQTRVNKFQRGRRDKKKET